MSKRRKAIIVTVCGVVLLIGGLARFAIFSIMLTARHESARAEIISSSLAQKLVRLPGGEPFMRFRPKIEYTFDYKGKTYRIERYERHEKNRTLASSKATIEKYPEGKKVIVYFPPDKPEKAFINTEPPSSFAFALAVAGLALLVIGVRQTKKSRRLRKRR